MTFTQELVIQALEEIGAEQKGYYGVISFHFQDGVLAVIRREQTLMPNQVTKEERKNLHARNATV